MSRTRRSRASTSGIRRLRPRMSGTGACRRSTSRRASCPPASADHRDPREPQGPLGPQGPKGDTGAPGISGLQVVKNESAFSSEAKDTAATCPAGKQVIGSGVDINGGFGEVAIDHVIPGATQVSVQAFEKAGGSTLDWSIIAIAICANVS